MGYAQQIRVCVQRFLADQIPRVALYRVIANFLPSHVQFGKKIARKISFARPRQICGIFRLKNESCPALDDVLFQRAYVGGENRKAKAVSQKHYAALENLAIGEHKRIRSFEINLSFAVRYKFISDYASPILSFFPNLF